MKTAALFVLLLGIQDKKGEVFKAEEGRFEAWYPSAPAYERQPDDRGPAWDTHKHRVDLRDRVLTVSYYQAPEVEDVDAFAKNLKKVYVDMKWKIQKEGRLSMGEHKGMSLTTLDPEGIVTQHRLYFVKTRRYHVTVTTAKTVSPTHPDLQKFLASFKILGEGK